MNSIEIVARATACAKAAPEIYRLDDDAELELLVEEVPAEWLARAEAGARVCPVAALRLRS